MYVEVRCNITQHTPYYAVHCKSTGWGNTWRSFRPNALLGDVALCTSAQHGVLCYFVERHGYWQFVSARPAAGECNGREYVPPTTAGNRCCRERLRVREEVV